MKTTIIQILYRYICMTVLLFICVFLFFGSTVQNNNVLFDTDEMYWIQTAKIVPLLLTQKYTDDFWNEYYGFFNFNTAKYIYGLGLPALGIHDFSGIGTPPDTYYRWETYTDKAFPITQELYSTVYKARMISVFITSIAICGMYILVLMITSSVLLSLTASLLLTVHETTLYIATHALADSIFLLFEILTLLYITRMLVYLAQKKPVPIVMQFMLGATLALLAGTKINGIIFVPFTVAALLLADFLPDKPKAEQEAPYYFRSLFNPLFLLLSFALFFLFLHPNFIFFQDVSPIDMIRGRILITRQHVAFFLQTDPSHVLITIGSRVRASLTHIFPVWLFIIISAISIYVALTRSAAEKRSIKLIVLVYQTGLFFLWICVISYTVFDEQRYFLPLIPILILVIILPLSTHNAFMTRFDLRRRK